MISHDNKTKIMNCFEKFVIFVKLKGFRGRSPPPPFVFIMMFAKKGMDVMLVGVVENGSI